MLHWVASGHATPAMNATPSMSFGVGDPGLAGLKVTTWPLPAAVHCSGVVAGTTHAIDPPSEMEAGVGDPGAAGSNAVSSSSFPIAAQFEVDQHATEDSW